MGKTTQIRIDSNLKNQIEEEAMKKGVNIKDFIQILYDNYLQQNKLDNLGKKLKYIDEQNFLIVHMINALGWSIPNIQEIDYDDYSTLLETAKHDLAKLKHNTSIKRIY